MRPEAAPPSGRDVGDRGPASLLGLARACPLLVHGPGRDLLGGILGAAALLQALLDVLLLAFALGAPGFLGHDGSFPVRAGLPVPPYRPGRLSPRRSRFRLAWTRVPWQGRRRRKPWSTSARRSRGRAIWRAGPARSRRSVAARSARSTSRGRPGPA